MGALGGVNSSHATHFPRSRTHIPLVAHRWRAFPVLQRRETEVGKSKCWEGEETPPDIARSPVHLLDFEPPALGPCFDLNSWGLRSTRLEAEGSGT